MRLTQEEARQRLGSRENLVNSLSSLSSLPLSSNPVEEGKVIIKRAPNGRSGRKTIPDFLRVKIGTAAHSENQREIAEEFGVSQSVVSKSKSGESGNGRVKDQIAENVSKVRDLALDRLMGALGLMDDEKLLNQDAKALAGIASQLSRVVKDVTPDTHDSEKDSSVKVIIYAPQQREEEKFEVIDV